MATMTAPFLLLQVAAASAVLAQAPYKGHGVASVPPEVIRAESR